MDVEAGGRSMTVTVRGGKAAGPVRWLPPATGRWSATIAPPGGRPRTTSIPKGGLAAPTQAGTVVRLIRSPR
jgi:hypothetical protein